MSCVGSGVRSDQLAAANHATSRMLQPGSELEFYYSECIEGNTFQVEATLSLDFCVPGFALHMLDRIYYSAYRCRNTYCIIYDL